MGNKDKQHYVSQSYLRNFSPDLAEYMKKREKLDDKKKRKLKSKMKIYYYDIGSDSICYGKISSLAKVNHYLNPTVDATVRKTENKLSLLKEIIANRSEDFLYQNDNQDTLWEIANCMLAKSIGFRDFAKLINLRTVGEMIDRSTGTKIGAVAFTEESAEFFQTKFLTDDPDILYPMMLKSMKIKLPSANLDGTFERLFEERGIEKKPKETDNDMFPISNHIPKPIYPCLIENFTDFPFITGDACVPKTEYILPDMKTRIPVFHFPINSDLAIIFLEERYQEKHIPRKITYKWDTFKWNRLIYNCSTYYLFSTQPYQLGTVTSYPKDLVDLDKNIRESQLEESDKGKQS